MRDDVSPGEFVVMPDHFHGLIRIQKGRSDLGHVIGAFKAAVSRSIRRGDTHVALSSLPDTHAAHAAHADTHAAHADTHAAHADTHAAPPKNIRIWHRNYYESIVRTPAAADNITEYIRMNPWRCVTAFGDSLRGIGNPVLWNSEKVGVLCSRNARYPDSIPAATSYMGGFHSPMEKEIFARLLAMKRPLIWCPAWGLDRAASAPGVLEALEQNRILILEMLNQDGNLAASEQRNAFVIDNAERLWLPHVTPGGMLDRLIEAAEARDKIIAKTTYEQNTLRSHL